MPDTTPMNPPADEACRLDRTVGRPAPERTCEDGCNGCDECSDYDYDELLECSRCRGDRRDPMTDYLLPCPKCGGHEC